MRHGELCYNVGTDTRLGLSLQRMPTPIWQRGGNEVTCVFCPGCGVRIYHALQSAPNVLALKPGTLADTSWLRPDTFIWMRSAQGWVPVPDGVEALEGQI
jgi:hypothetical protein